MPAAAAALEVHRFYGYAFDDSDGKFLFTEVHQHLYEGGHWLSGTIRYYGPDNQLIGDKSLEFPQDPYVPLYRLRLPHDNYEEGVTAVGSAGIELEKVVDGRREHEHVERAPVMVADSGLYNFVMDHLAELQSGKVLPFVFVVASRLGSYRFRIRKSGELLSREGHPAMRITIEADSVLRLVAPALSMLYDLQTHYLLEYHGVTHIRDPLTGRGYSAVKIVFPAKPPPGVPLPQPPFDGG